jgi:hypothetical protein
MAQADGVVANGTGSAVRSDINTQYAALWSNHSGSTEPSSGKVAYQTWADTNSGYLKIRNAANNAWIQLFKLDGTDICRLTGSTNNQITTVTGANSIQGEAKLTFDGDTLKFTHDAVTGFDSNSQDFLVIENGDSDTYINIATGATRDSGLLFSNGTRAEGYITYSHDTDDLCVSATDDIWFRTAGSERVRIDSSGKVGIGTASPNDALEISHASDPAIRLHYGSNSGYSVISIDSANDVKIDVDPSGAAADSNFQVHIDGTEMLEVQSDGDLKINDGNLVIGTAGHGIDFSATSHAAGMSSELLDSYEEGTGTMQLDGQGGSSPSTQCDSSTCHYTKIGRQVTVMVAWDSKNLAGIGGQIAIRNLPFTVSNATGHFIIIPAMLNNIAWSGDEKHCFYTSSNTTSAYGLSSRDGNTWVNWAAGDWDNSTSISLYLTFTYFTDS